MATPKRKVSHARTAQRKAHWLGALSAPETMRCPKCGEATLAHHAYRRSSKLVRYNEILTRAGGMYVSMSPAL